MNSFPWQILLDWYEIHGRHDFPWRQYTQDDRENGYRVWLAEILLQQTQADRVISFYNRMREKYPSITHLAQTSYEEFFPYYQGLGYYSRARNLLKTAEIVSRDYDGVFSTDRSILKQLPGVGEYTSRAILAFGYGKPLLAWDTNLETIFSRYYRGAKNIKLSPEEKETIETDFRNFITSNSGAKFGESVSEKGEKNIVRDTNNALMDWARLMEPKNASLLDPENYIFRESLFYMTRGNDEVIEKKKTEYFPIPDAQIVVILHQDHKIYYSTSSEAYISFILPPSEDRDTRRYVQEYFRNKYHLELSVRPVHKKWINDDGKPYIAVNAQIQAGDATIFQKFSKKEFQGYNFELL